MYRMHQIFLIDYEEFGLKRNHELDRLYLYKCFAYLPFLIISKTYFLFNKIDITDEISIIFDKIENNRFDVFDEFMTFLSKNNYQFNLSNNDIQLMKNVVKDYFAPDFTKDNMHILD